MGQQNWKNRPKRNQNEPLDEVLERRNTRLLNFFEQANIPVRLIGDPNNPAVIYRECVLLSCYVHNFFLHFTDKPYEGNKIGTFKLTSHLRADHDLIMRMIKDSVHKKIFNVRMKDKELYLAGYNFTDQKSSLGRYPVFAQFKYKVYYSRETAEARAQELIDDGYEVEVYDPGLKSDLKSEESHNNK